MASTSVAPLIAASASRAKLGELEREELDGGAGEDLLACVRSPSPQFAHHVGWDRYGQAVLERTRQRAFSHAGVGVPARSARPCRA
jgi:hypothetical protein